MNTILNYNKKINNFIINEIKSITELMIYNLLLGISELYKSIEVYATYETIMNELNINDKSTVHRAIRNLERKGLISIGKRKAKTNNFKVNVYYIETDITQTALFKGLTAERQQKYISVVPDPPQQQPTTAPEHTPEQEQLFDICKKVFGIKDISFKKTQILLDIAQANKDIDNSNIVDAIKSIVSDAYSKAKTVIINRFGYAKKCLKNYSKYVPVVPTVTETPAAETETTTISEELKELIDFNNRNKLNFTQKQLSALNTIAIKKSVVLIDILRQVLNTNLSKIKDLYKYVCGCIRNKAKQQTTQTTADNNTDDYNKLAITGADNNYSWSDFVPFTEQEIESLCISNRVVCATESEATQEIEPNRIDTDNLNDSLIEQEKPIDCIEPQNNAETDDQYTIKQTYSLDDIRAFLDSLKHDNSPTTDNSTTDSSYSCTSVMSRLYSGVTTDTKQKIYNDNSDIDNTEQLRQQQLKLLFGY